MKRSELIVFLGPSLPKVEAARLARAEFRPPARQGDVWRALESSPRAIALIDGVFEAQPSVWHREILSALSEGVAVFGASSMGALRAAELAPFGMIGIGKIFAAFASGKLIDDAEVALLHADAEHEFRALTVPLVNVRYAAERAVEAGVLTAREAKRLVTDAAAIFYQERSWRAVAEVLAGGERGDRAGGQRSDTAGGPSGGRAGGRGAARAVPAGRSAASGTSRRAPFLSWVSTAAVDLKALDAAECLRACDAYVRSGAPSHTLSLPPPSALVRHRRFADRGGTRVLSALQMQADAAELRSRGGAELIAETLGSALGASAEDWISEAPWRLADGPDPAEALVRGARRTGRWDRLLSELSGRSSRGRRR